MNKCKNKIIQSSYVQYVNKKCNRNMSFLI
uniref:Uncharacterized protein n=1 Tax=Anguilla anguilla TaxID=7936 RepID=A0A0E9XE87_ANGAN